MIWLIVAAIIIGTALWYFLVKPLSYWSDKGVLQTKPWILFGDSWINLFRRMSVCDFIQWLYQLHPNERYIGFYQFMRPVLLLRDPELIKQVGVKDFDSFTDHRAFVNPDADPLWSKNLLALTGDRWKEMRNVVSPTFTSSKIKNIFVLMAETAENFVNYFQGIDDDVIELDMKDTYSRFTNDIIATTAFGVKVDSLQNRQNTFYEMGKRITNVGGVINTLKFIGHQAVPTLLKIISSFIKGSADFCIDCKFSKKEKRERLTYIGIGFLDPIASKYFGEVVNDTIKIREQKKITRPDLLNLLIDARKDQSNGISDPEKHEEKAKRVVQISNAEITSQAVIFFFAGFETVSRMMCFGSHELALNKKIQNRLREEILDTAKKGKITYDALQQMPYMDMVVSEILRKWPPFPAPDRVCTKPYTIEPVNESHKAVHIKEGTEIMVPIFALQRDPKYYPDPERFDPERFSEENKNNIVPYTYLPFGVGPRICIGNRFALVEIKALFFHLLLQYEIVPTKKTSIPIVLAKDFLVDAEGGFHLGLKRIKA